MEKSKTGRRLDRRGFMGLTALGAANWALSGAPKAAAATREDTKMKPCRYWMHGFKGDDPKATARQLRDT